MRHLVISDKIQRISLQFKHFKISGKSKNQEKSYNKRYLPLNFSKYNETSPKSDYS